MSSSRASSCRPTSASSLREKGYVSMEVVVNARHVHPNRQALKAQRQLAPSKRLLPTLKKGTACRQYAGNGATDKINIQGITARRRGAAVRRHAPEQGFGLCRRGHKPVPNGPCSHRQLLSLVYSKHLVRRAVALPFDSDARALRAAFQSNDLSEQCCTIPLNTACPGSAARTAAHSCSP